MVWCTSCFGKSSPQRHGADVPGWESAASRPQGGEPQHCSAAHNHWGADISVTENQSLASIFESALRQQWKGSNGNLQVQLSSVEAERIVSQQYPYIFEEKMKNRISKLPWTLFFPHNNRTFRSERPGRPRHPRPCQRPGRWWRWSVSPGHSASGRPGLGDL